MPRIRSIKPEFWTNGRVLECSTNARLLFIGLWNFCDDTGRHPMRPKQIKAQIFPADDFDSESIRGMIRELSENGLVTLYSVGSDDFIQVEGWDHQRIDKPQPSRYPAPEEGHSTNVPGTFPPDRKGEDRKGGDGMGDASRKRAKRASAIPASFPGSDELDWAKQNHPAVDAHHEANQFREHAAATGRTMKDWPAAWRMWIGKAAKWQKQDSPTESPSERAAREAREYRQRKQAGAA